MRSKRPGRNRAESRAPGRFVAAKICTPDGKNVPSKLAVKHMVLHVSLIHCAEHGCDGKDKVGSMHTACCLTFPSTLHLV